MRQNTTITPAGRLIVRNLGSTPPSADSAIEAVQVFFDRDESDLRPAESPPYAELEFVAAPGSDRLDLTFTIEPVSQAG